jgi:tellurite resistance protein
MNLAAAFKVLDRRVTRCLEAGVAIACADGTTDAEHMNRSIGQLARHSLAAWKKETPHVNR